MWANRSDEELLRALPREPGAFSAFYRRHVDDVLGFLARRCRDPEQAADLTAEVFATVLLQARRYRPERGTPIAWLFAIAAHKHSDAWRRAAAEEARDAGVTPAAIRQRVSRGLAVLRTRLERETP
jgi:RNA polymerase sigma-70 factor (ECF subfamily)